MSDKTCMLKVPVFGAYRISENSKSVRPSARQTTKTYGGVDAAHILRGTGDRGGHDCANSKLVARSGKECTDFALL